MRLPHMEERQTAEPTAEPTTTYSHKEGRMIFQVQVERKISFQCQAQVNLKLNILNLKIYNLFLK